MASLLPGRMFHELTRSISSTIHAENLKKFAVGVALWSQRQESTTRQEPSTRSGILCARNAPLPTRDQWQAAKRAGWQAAGTNKATLLKCFAIKRTGSLSLKSECSL